MSHTRPRHTYAASAPASRSRPSSGSDDPIAPPTTIVPPGASLRASASNGFSFFAVQGRVDESLSGPARGLEVRTTASGNVSTNDVPMLSLATPGITAPLLYTITALPVNGVLRDASNQLITTVPYNLSSPLVNYTPNSGFIGLDTFTFSVSNGVISSNAAGRIGVSLPDCRTNVKGCNDGR